MLKFTIDDLGLDSKYEFIKFISKHTLKKYFKLYITRGEWYDI